MAVLKRRPRLSMIAPRSIDTGRDVELSAIVDCAAPVDVRAIDLEVVGRAVWLTSSQYGDQRQTSPFFRACAPLFAGGELAAGRLVLPARICLPTGLPGTYRGRRIHIEYVASIKVDIPWWPDAAGSFDLHVAAHDTPASARPIVLYSSPDGPSGRGAYFELSLPTTGLVPGSRLEMAVSFSNLEHNRYRVLEIELLAVETIEGFLAGGTTERSATRWVAELDDVREGQPFRTRVVVPSDLAPAFAVQRIRLAWILRVRAKVAWGRDPVVEVPVSVHRGEAAEVAVRAPPVVGSERVTALWRQVGAESGLTLVDGVLAGAAAGAARVSIWREMSGRRGPLLIGEIDCPDLRIGLELDGRRRTPIARDQRQSEILIGRLHGALRDAGAVSATDRQLRCAARGSGARKGQLAAFVTSLVALARELAVVRAELPVPARLAGEIDQWSATGRALGARLEPAGPTLLGELAGIAFAMGVTWTDGEPSELEVILSAVTPIDRRHHLRWEEWEPRPAGDEIAAACEAARALEIDRTTVRARYPREVGLDGAAAQLPILAGLINQLARGPAGGAYR